MATGSPREARLEPKWLRRSRMGVPSVQCDVRKREPAAIPLRGGTWHQGSGAGDKHCAPLRRLQNLLRAQGPIHRTCMRSQNGEKRQGSSARGWMDASSGRTGATTARGMANRNRRFWQDHESQRQHYHYSRMGGSDIQIALRTRRGTGIRTSRTSGDAGVASPVVGCEGH